MAKVISRSLTLTLKIYARPPKRSMLSRAQRRVSGACGQVARCSGHDELLGIFSIWTMRVPAEGASETVIAAALLNIVLQLPSLG